MNRVFLFTASLLAACLASCGSRQHEAPTPPVPDQLGVIAGDSTTCYGLASDGCTDSILIVLSLDAERLDTFDITEVRQKHRILGRPHIGDEIAVVLKSDTMLADGKPSAGCEVDRVVNLSMLQGQWKYLVHPTLRHQPARPLPDSLMKRLMVPREYTLRLKRDGSAYIQGMRQQQSADNMSPVVYQPVKRYRSWTLSAGRLVLHTDTARLQQADTADIRLLRRDSLVLLFGGQPQGYYKSKQ